MKLRHYFPALAALACVGVAATAQQPDVVGPVGEKIPEVRLPVEKPVNVGQYDAVRAADAFSWHVVQSKGPEAWAKNPRAKGKGVRVAVLDTGAQVDHPAIRNSIKATYNAIDKTKNVTDRNGHGTHCADTVRQLAPEVDLVIVKVLGDNGSGRVDQIAHGIDWAVTEGKADVLSLSLGGPQADRWQQEAIDRALKAGVIVIAAAGNSGPGDTEGWPGRIPGVVSVGAADRNNRLAAFSSHGPNVFTVKYGVDIRAALPGNQEGEMSGTSMATPSEAACAAAWIACHPQIARIERPAAFRRAVLEVSPFKDRNNARGHGMYTLDRLVPANVAPPPTPTPSKPVAVTITLDDLTPAKREELRLGGVTKFRLEVGHDATAAKPAEMPEVMRQPAPQPAPATVFAPAPVFTPSPQYVPGPCPGGVCPAPVYYPPQPQGWTPGTVIRRVFR